MILYGFMPIEIIDVLRNVAKQVTKGYSNRFKINKGDHFANKY